jgi:hypothetical protein
MNRILVLEVMAEGFGTNLFVEQIDNGIRFVEIPGSSFSAEEMEISEEEYQKIYQPRYHRSFREFWTKFAKHDWFYLTYYCSDQNIQIFIRDEMKKAIKDVDLNIPSRRILDERMKERQKHTFIRDHVRDPRPTYILIKFKYCI